MNSNSKIAFITGITGQDGSYLSELLLEKGYWVYGIIRRMSSINTKRIDHLYNNQKFQIRYGDLTDACGILNILTNIVKEHSDIQNLEIYNLGAQSHVKVSFELPDYTGNVDALGTLRLLEAIRSLPIDQSKIRFYQASTSEMFGKVQEKPQKETTPFYPRSPYGCAKLYSHWITKNYRESYNLYACSGILFNHESPRRGETFVTRKITKGLAMIIKGEKDKITLGNLDSLRDWGHAKDYVYGMWLMLQQEKPDDYILATGVMVSVREFIEYCFLLKGFNIRWEGQGIDEKGYDQNGVIRIDISEKYFRPAEVDELCGDSSKAKNILGWCPQIDWKTLAKEMVEHDC